MVATDSLQTLAKKTHDVVYLQPLRTTQCRVEMVRGRLNLEIRCS
jgi:hypothetical protein